MRALVYGLGVAGEAVARQLVRRGVEVVTADDKPTARTREFAERLGVELVDAPDADALSAVIASADLVLPAPPVPVHHPVHRLADAQGKPVQSEFALAAEWAGPDLEIVAITGTNGKTTVTTLVTDMLLESGRKAVAAGNNDLPLVDALDLELDVVVVEASSFRLYNSGEFRPSVAVWLNFAEDHLDWHRSMDHYRDAKARIWANQAGDDLALANADDPVVMTASRSASCRTQTFGLADAHWHWDAGDGTLRDPQGDVIVEVARLARALPHDISNALAACGAALAAGATPAACASVLASFRGLPHRLTLVGDAGGVRYYDDSKATTPASVVTALRAFDSSVLIAGGRNKGLDLSPLRDEASRVRAVVAIGEAALDVQRVFAGVRPVVTAASMDAAVAAARDLAQAGDVVLLSPGCASYDWYKNYSERGDDFARAARELAGAA